ncbi:MAG: tetratricopeptide repeat protein [Planctomycetota bacterium]|nr:tetratricopeptide repeat protein [Planctomycetota bacterium]
MTIQEALQLAGAHHQAGRLADAEAIYRQILAHDPNHPETLQRLGVLACQANRPDIGENLITRAIQLEPANPEFHNNLGTLLRTQNRMIGALAAFRQALKTDPNHVLAQINLANTLQDTQSFEEAVIAYRRAVDLSPASINCYGPLGNALCQTGEIDQAILCFRRALERQPDAPEIYNDLGDALRRKQRFSEAIPCFERALVLRPNFAGAANNLGNAFFESGRIEESIAMLQRAAALEPGSPHFHFNLGNALFEAKRHPEAVVAYQKSLETGSLDVDVLNRLGNALTLCGRFEEAVACFKKAISVEPRFSWPHNNLANTYQLLGNFEQAEACVRRAIDCDAADPTFHWNLGITLLTQGRFEEGWKEYAWRSKVKEFNFIRTGFSQPQWNGEDFSGKTILLHGEQGAGDTLQFARYVPMVKARGGKIIFGCRPNLERLLEGQIPIDQFENSNGPPREFDLHCPLLSLPMVFGTTVETIPASVPYLAAKPQDREKWKDRLSTVNGLKVGLAWAGNPLHENDRNRTIPFAALAPLASVAGISLISLQVGNHQKNTSGILPKLIDWTNELHDFADTAGLVANLDLVISADTSVAHLAGAMAKPVWMLIPFAPDWRWFLDREDSPWYPTMKIFRQTKPGDWTSPVERLKQSLENLVKGHA